MDVQPDVIGSTTMSVNGSAEELPDDPRVSMLDYL